MRSFVRLVARVRFFEFLALLLGPFRDDLGLVLGLLGPLFGSAGLFLTFSWGGFWLFCTVYVHPQKCFIRFLFNVAFTCIHFCYFHPLCDVPFT